MISPSKALAQSDGRYGGVVSIELAIDEIITVLLEFSDYGTEQGHYAYRDNEIGAMAAEIGWLAEGEISARTREEDLTGRGG